MPCPVSTKLERARFFRVQFGKVTVCLLANSVLEPENLKKMVGLRNFSKTLTICSALEHSVFKKNNWEVC